MKTKASRRTELKRYRKPLISFSLCLFLVLVAFAVIGRILELNIVVVHICNRAIFDGPEAISNPFSMMEWFMTIAVLCGGAQLLVSLSGVISRSWRRVDLMFGTVNVCLAIGMFFFWAQLWAWWHPFHPLGEAVNRTFAHSPFGWTNKIELGEFEYRSPDVYPGWERLDGEMNGEPVYRQIRSGVTSQTELVYSCMPDRIWQANTRLFEESGRIEPGFSDNYPTDDVYGAVLRDEDGRYIAPSPIGDGNAWSLDYRYDPVASAFRKERLETPPEYSYEDIIDIMNEDYDAAFPEPSQRVRDNIEFEDFMASYDRIMANKAERSERAR